MDFSENGVCSFGAKSRTSFSVFGGLGGSLDKRGTGIVRRQRLWPTAACRLLQTGCRAQRHILIKNDSLKLSRLTGRRSRWLDGLYFDAPEEMDDPYRFFRW
jgi:hypothetical protein